MVGAGVRTTVVAPADAVAVGVAVGLGSATGATEPPRGKPPLATSAIPKASKNAPTSSVKGRGMRVLSDAERMPSGRASVADRRTRAAAKLRERGFAALAVSPGADLFYLSGYQMFPS